MKHKFYVERRRVILRTAEEVDALDYVYQAYPNSNQKENRRSEKLALSEKIKNIEDGRFVITILREDGKFIGFLFTRQINSNENELMFLDLVIPDSLNKVKYAEDCIKQFVKVMTENEMCRVIVFKGEYKSSECEKYIEEFLKKYPSRRIEVEVV